MKSFTVGVILALLMGSPVWAAKDSREKQMLRRVQQQAQQAEQARVQAEQEKASLLAEKESLEKEYKQTQSEVNTAKRRANTAHAETARLNKDLESMRKEVAILKTGHEAVQKQLSDSQQLQRITAQNLLTTETAKKQIESSLGDRDKNLHLCRDSNTRLYKVGRELMVKYQEKSCKDAMLQTEPFTGLKKVEMENLFEAWRDDLDREKIR